VAILTTQNAASLTQIYAQVFFIILVPKFHTCGDMSSKIASVRPLLVKRGQSCKIKNADSKVSLSLNVTTLLTKNSGLKY